MRQALRKREHPSLGRSRGGWTTKLQALIMARAYEGDQTGSLVRALGCDRVVPLMAGRLEP